MNFWDAFTQGFTPAFNSGYDKSADAYTNEQKKIAADAKDKADYEYKRQQQKADLEYKKQQQKADLEYKKQQKKIEDQANFEAAQPAIKAIQSGKMTVDNPPDYTNAFLQIANSASDMGNLNQDITNPYVEKQSVIDMPADKQNEYLTNLLQNPDKRYYSAAMEMVKSRDAKAKADLKEKELTAKNQGKIIRVGSGKGVKSYFGDNYGNADFTRPVNPRYGTAGGESGSGKVKEQKDIYDLNSDFKESWQDIQHKQTIIDMLNTTPGLKIPVKDTSSSFYGDENYPIEGDKGLKNQVNIGRTILSEKVKNNMTPNAIKVYSEMYNAPKGQDQVPGNPSETEFQAYLEDQYAKGNIDKKELAQFQRLHMTTYGNRWGH